MKTIVAGLRIQYVITQLSEVTSETWILSSYNPLLIQDILKKVMAKQKSLEIVIIQVAMLSMIQQGLRVRSYILGDPHHTSGSINLHQYFEHDVLQYRCLAFPLTRSINIKEVRNLMIFLPALGKSYRVYWTMQLQRNEANASAGSFICSGNSWGVFW